MSSQVALSSYDAFSDPQTWSLLKQHSLVSNSAENVLFFEDVETYRSLFDPMLRRKKANEIFEKYFSPGSFFELETLQETIKKDVASQLKEADATLFDEAQQFVSSSLEGKEISSFCSSDLFTTYSSETSFQTTLHLSSMLERIIDY